MRSFHARIRKLIVIFLLRKMTIFTHPSMRRTVPASSFYMKQNADGKTGRAMDVLFPWMGEIIGGSQREDNYDKLYARMNEMHIPEKRFCGGILKQESLAPVLMRVLG